MVKKSRLCRRPAKWPYVLVFTLMITGAGAYWIFWKRALAPQQGEITLSTWSRFQDMKRLQMLLQGFAVKSIADIPCVDIDQLDIQQLGLQRYLGISKQRHVATVLQSQFGSSMASFLDLDVTIDTLPRVDLILCWDYLCTLSEVEIRSTLLQFKKSGATFLLMRHFPEIQSNEKKVSGHFQPINWEHHPYYFPEPMIHIVENKDHGMESLSLWSLKDLP
jgi:hypothetical protein